MDRILILGSPGSGKTTLGELIDSKHDHAHLDLDDVSWEKKFTVKRSKEERKKIIKKFIKNKKWVLTGVARDWINDAEKKADIIIVLKISFLSSIYRAVRRYFKRRGTYHESLKTTFELIGWSWRTFHKPNAPGKDHYKRIKKEYPSKYIPLKGTTKGLKEFLTNLEEYHK